MAEAVLPATIKATPAAEFAAAAPPTAPSAPPPAAPPAVLSHLLAQPPEEPPQERSSPPRSRQPTKEYIDTREARVQRRRVSQLICGPVVAQLICGPGVYQVGGWPARACCRFLAYVEVRSEGNLSGRGG